MAQEMVYEGALAGAGDTVSAGMWRRSPMTTPSPLTDVPRFGLASVGERVLCVHCMQPWPHSPRHLLVAVVRRAGRLVRDLRIHRSQGLCEEEVLRTISIAASRAPLTKRCECRLVRIAKLAFPSTRACRA
eukprot:scaffold907_cov247-Pinguiococcus_pyrenoidosus.AAC.10